MSVGAHSPNPVDEVALRQRLTAITLDTDVSRHPRMIEELRQEVPHTLVVRESPAPVDRYTCAVWAFDLVEDPTYLGVASHGLGRTFAGKEFIDFLLADGLLTPRADDEVLPGDLILYFDAGPFRHVGRMLANGRVASKWGTGLLYEHDVWCVPTNYGDEVRYFAGPTAEASLELFMAYARTRGFDFESPSE